MFALKLNRTAIALVLRYTIAAIAAIAAIVAAWAVVAGTAFHATLAAPATAAKNNFEWGI